LEKKGSGIWAGLGSKMEQYDKQMKISSPPEKIK
jgi:hypothetical protein